MEKFSIVEHPVEKWGLTYSPVDLSFDSKLKDESGCSWSLVINEINISLNDTGEVDSLWGLCPYQSWKLKKLEPPSPTDGRLLYEKYIKMVPGVSQNLGGGTRWSVYFDPTAGWICIDSSLVGSISIRIAAEIIFELDDEKNIVRVWLRPDEIPQIH